MPNKHAAFHPSADSSVANTQRHTTHLKLFCKRLGLHYTRLLNNRKRHFKLPPRKQSISSKQAEHPRTKSAENIFCTPNAAEAGLTGTLRPVGAAKPTATPCPSSQTTKASARSWPASPTASSSTPSPRKKAASWPTSLRSLSAPSSAPPNHPNRRSARRQNRPQNELPPLPPIPPGGIFWCQVSL